jgi:hypothetical protein
MSSTHLSLHYHIVFGTKNHKPMTVVAGVSPAISKSLQPTRLPLQNEQQAEHHRTRTFREEYLELLDRSGVEFDERYV